MDIEDHGKNDPRYYPKSDKARKFSALSDPSRLRIFPSTSPFPVDLARLSVHGKPFSPSIARLAAQVASERPPTLTPKVNIVGQESIWVI